MLKETIQQVRDYVSESGKQKAKLVGKYVKTKYEMFRKTHKFQDMNNFISDKIYSSF